MRRWVSFKSAKLAALEHKGIVALVSAALLLVVMTIGPALAAGPVAFNGLGNRVYAQTLGGGEVCLTLGEEPDFGMIQTLDLNQNSHVLVSFTFHIGDLAQGELADLHIALDGAYGHEWPLAGNNWGLTSGTLTWSFANVPTGMHEITAGGRVSGDDSAPAQLGNCALTVTTVIPAP